MKKLQPLLCLLSLLIFLVTARADVPDALSLPATSTPAATDSSPSAADAASQPVDPAKAAEIRKMLESTGRIKVMQQISEQMIARAKKQNNGVSSEFWDRLEKEMNIQGFLDKMVPIYAKYYTLDDLKAINAFYETPAGQRYVAAYPQIMQECMPIAQDWAKMVLNRVKSELKEEKEKGSASAPAAAPPAAPSVTPAPAPAPASH